MKNVKGVSFLPLLFSILSMIIIANVFIGAWLFYPPSQTINEGFETGVGEWMTDAEVPLDPNNPGHPIEWHITRTVDHPHSGQHSLKFFVDGRQDEGAIWIERRLNVKKNTKIRVTLTFHLYSEWESSNSIAGVCAYVDALDPEIESDFEAGKLGPANQVAGWKQYQYTTKIMTDSTGEIWIGFGIYVLWETYMTYYIDDVAIEIHQTIF